jgi:hypothetical protein
MPQQEAVWNYLKGGSWQLVAEVIEVESCKRSDRPKLQEALRLCRKHGATLILPSPCFPVVLLQDSKPRSREQRPSRHGVVGSNGP